MDTAGLDLEAVLNKPFFFPELDQTASILGSMGHASLYPDFAVCHTQGVPDDTYTKELGSVLIKPYLQKHMASWAWPTCHS